MWELDHKESWALKNWCFQTVALKKTLESPSVCKEIKPVNPKENQPWIFIGRTDAEAEAEALILWPPSAKSQLIGQNPDAGKDWRQEEKGMTEDELVGWHHQLNGHESEWSLGGSEGQGSLECCSPWSHKESDVTEQLNKNNLLSMRFNYSLIILTQKTQCLSRNVLILLRLISWCRPWFIPRMQLFMFQILYII